MNRYLAGLLPLVVLPVALLGLVGGAWQMSDGASTCVAGQCASAGSVSARRFEGADGYVDDPTSGGFISLRMLHIHSEIERQFDWSWGVACWDEHAWNPSSDHPRGRACDYTVGVLGQLPSDVERLQGWDLALWLEANSEALGVSYVIFDGKIWSAVRQGEGWRGYDGGGVYDPEAFTGGHFDHVHVSAAS